MTFDQHASDQSELRSADTSSRRPQLHLLAVDGDDLAILSANLQDMQVGVGDLAYLPEERRFAFVGKRFDWVQAANGGCHRCETGVHFDCVLGVSRVGFAQSEMARVLNLLAIEFQAGEAPGGLVTLIFSGGAAVRLVVECLEGQMRDLGPRWPCECQPAHPVGAEAQSAGDSR